MKQASNQARAGRQEPRNRKIGRTPLDVTPAAYYTGLNRVGCDVVGPREKVGQEVGRLDRRAPVKGHEGGRSAGQRDKVSPPSVGPYGRHFDLVDTAVDSLFETV